MTHDVVLTIHVAFGIVGVGLGPIVVWQVYRRRLTGLADAFHATVVGVVVSSFGLAALRFGELWWLIPIGLGTYALALRGFLATRRRQDPGWAASTVRGYGGTYIALWTAILVISAGSSVLTWLLPALVGTPIVELLALRLHRHSATLR